MQHDIARDAGRLRIAVFAVGGLIAVLYGAARLGAGGADVHVVMRTHGLTGLAAQVVADATVLLLLAALFELTRMLGRIRNGELFSVRVIRRFRGFAFWLLMLALLGFLAPLIGELVRPAEAGAAPFSLLLDLRQLLTLGIALLLFLLARLLERAREIEAEMQEYV